MASVAQSVPKRRFRISNTASIRLRRYGLRSVAVIYLGAMIAVPVIACIQKGFANGMDSFKEAMASQGAWEAIGLTLAGSTMAAVINGIFGTLIAYAIVRYEFRGRAVLSAIVDLPLAIPTLVTGVMLVVIYGPNSPVGSFLNDRGIKVVFAQLGVLLALLVVTLPFVVRTVQPVLSELDEAEEEAAATLGASPWKTFRTVVLVAAGLRALPG
jgi:sulfate transport system permease protein